ncbi:MAG: FHA domain-containing protein [Anaerolineaceae bacterium]|nr:MAG: FHA domain-containing protein [Anaerolineaceae bacterium]
MIATIVLVLRLALASALYLFLAWALLTLWRELKQEGQKLATKKPTGIVIIQKQEDSDEEQSFRFYQAEIIIGRHSQCDLSVADETLSAQHARLVYRRNLWWLEDLGSTNGTFLNNSPLITPAVVIADDTIKCGNTFFRLQIDNDENFAHKN